MRILILAINSDNRYKFTTMKILVLTFYYKPDLCAGSFRATALVNALQTSYKGSVEIEVITTLPNRYSSFNAKAEVFEKRDGVTVHRVKLPAHQSGMKDQAKAFLSYFFSVIKLTREKDYDLVYGTSSRLMTAVLASFIALRKKTKLYLDIRDIFVDTIGDVMSPRWGKFFKFIEKWSFSKALSINLVSEGFRSYFEKILPGKRLTFFTNGIDDIFMHQIVTSRDPNDLPVILYAGNIGEGQGLHKVLPGLAMRLEGKAKFRILGDGGKKQLLKKKIESLKLKNVELCQPVDRNRLIEEYKKADVFFLHLNDYQAFRKVLPSKLFEYAAMGKPILAGLSGYPANFLESEVESVEIFEPCNIEEGVSAFSRLNYQSVDRREFKLKYSREKIMEEMAIDIYTLIKNGK